MCKKKIYRLCNVEQHEQDIKSRCNHTSYKMHENRCVLLKNDKHVRPMRFSILCTPTDSSDKTQLVYSTILLCLFVYKYDISAGRLNYSTLSRNQFKYINL